MNHLYLKLALVFSFFSSYLSAANPIQFLLPSENYTSFVFEDKAGNYWIGKGAWTNIYTRRKNGLVVYENGNKVTKDANGTYTAAIEFDGDVYISADDALHKFSNGVETTYTTIQSGTALAVFNDSLYIGTEGNGYFVFKNGFSRQVLATQNNNVCDSIYSFCNNGSSLLIGSSDGILSLNGSTHSTYLRNHQIDNNATYFKNYLCILSMAIDNKGRLWYATKGIGINVGFTNIMVKDGNSVQRASDYYNGQNKCVYTGLLPENVTCIKNTPDGKVIVPTYWGAIILGDAPEILPMDKTVKSSTFFYTEMFYANTTSVLTFSKTGALINTLSDGIYKIDLSTYDQNSFLDQLLYPYVSSTAEMNLNDIEATFQNNGFMYSMNNKKSNFKVSPALKLKSEPCNNIAYSHGIWIGAKNQNDSSIKVSRSTYENDSFEYVPGPINIITGEYDSALTVDYNRFWKIKRNEVEDFKLNHNNSGYIIPKNILDWPANGNSKTISKMAPFVDADNDQKYDPSKGDYPDMKGDMMFWWVFNDNVAHRAGRNLKFQINASCYAYHDKNLTQSDSNFLVNRTLLFDYEFINCSGQNQKEVIIGLFNDEDIGNYSDDAVSFDSASSTVFAYNGDSYDDLYRNKGFGFNPPILATQFLNQNLYKFVRQSGGTPISNDPSAAYNLMIAKGDEGKPYNQTQMAKYNYTPCEHDSSLNFPGDIRYLMSLKAGDMAHLSSYKLSFANYIQYDPNVNYLKQDCNKPLLNANKIKQWYTKGNFPSDPTWPLNVSDPKLQSSVFNVFPNPTNQFIHIDWSNHTQYEIKIYDLNGKLCLNVQAQENNQSIDVSQLVSGAYFIVAIADSGIVTSKFIKN